MARATRPPRPATRGPELPRATLRKGRAYWLELSPRFRPAIRRVCVSLAYRGLRRGAAFRPLQCRQFPAGVAFPVMSRVCATRTRRKRRAPAARLATTLTRYVAGRHRRVACATCKPFLKHALSVNPVLHPGREGEKAAEDRRSPRRCGACCRSSGESCRCQPVGLTKI